MNYTHFHQLFHPQAIISRAQIRMYDADFDDKQLTRWAQKGYLQALIKGYRVFSDMIHIPWVQLTISNMIYEPSYLSLERALAYYQIIPETVLHYTSVSTKKTQSFTINHHRYTYQHIKPTLYLGYDMININSHPVRIAQCEKALLDYIYLHPDVRTIEDYEAMRFNVYSLQDQIDRNRMTQYSLAYPRTVQQAVKYLYTYIDTNV